MDKQAEMDFGAGNSGHSRSGWGFTVGLLVGVAGTIGGLALAIASERRARRQGGVVDTSATASASTQETDEWRSEQAELDEELAQTFPASDPLPQSHRVD